MRAPAAAAGGEAVCFRRFFGNPLLSDFTLQISTDPGAASAEQPSSSSHHDQESGLHQAAGEGAAAAPGAAPERGALAPAASPAPEAADGDSGASASDGGGDAVPVHGVVLAAASGYFETLLRGWASPCRQLHMVVAREQLPAAQLLLGFMYASALPAGPLPQADVLQLLLLADRFDVPAAVAAARRALASLAPASLDWPTLLGVWSLPAHLWEGEAAAPLRECAWARLLQLCGDLEELWASADGRALFNALPLRAVCSLLQSDELAVASENTTLAAVSSWVAHQRCAGAAAVPPQAGGGQLQPQALSAAELRLLAASVRLPGLGPCYMAFVAPQTEWFRGALDVLSVCRAAAFAAASSEVRKDLVAHTSATTTAALQAAAALAALPGDCSAELSVPAGTECLGSTLGACAQGGSSARCSSCGGSQGGGSSSSTAGAGSGGESGCDSGVWGLELQAQLLKLAQAAQRPRAVSCRRSCAFAWRVDLAAIRALYEEVAAAGSRDSRILRSPAHSFAGYEWALQLEVTQTRGATGFDPAKPWSLGIFLTCQVRVDVPPSGCRAEPQPQPAAGLAAGLVPASRVSDAGGGQGSGSNSGGSGRTAAVASGGGGGGGSTAPQQQLVDFGFVSTQAIIAVREVGGKDKCCEKSWAHAVVRYRASWGWPNFLDTQARGWDDAALALERWLIEGQMHLTASVRVLG